MTATETKLGQAPKHSIWNKGPGTALSAEPWFWEERSRAFYECRVPSLALPPFALSAGQALSAYVYDVAQRQDSWHSKETRCGPNHAGLPSFFICWLRAKWTTEFSSWGAQSWHYFSGKQGPKHLERSFGLRTVPVAVNHLWTLWNILGLSLRSLSKLLTSLLSVKRQTTLSSELTWHWDMACLSLWLVASNVFLSILS